MLTGPRGSLNRPILGFGCSGVGPVPCFAFMFQWSPHLSSSSQLRGVLCTVAGRGMALPGSRPALCRAQGSLRRQQMSSASSEEETDPWHS